VSTLPPSLPPPPSLPLSLSLSSASKGGGDKKEAEERASRSVRSRPSTYSRVVSTLSAPLPQRACDEGGPRKKLANGSAAQGRWKNRVTFVPRATPLHAARRTFLCRDADGPPMDRRGAVLLFLKGISYDERRPGISDEIDYREIRVARLLRCLERIWNRGGGDGRRDAAFVSVSSNLSLSRSLPRRREQFFRAYAIPARKLRERNFSIYRDDRQRSIARCRKARAGRK